MPSIPLIPGSGLRLDHADFLLTDAQIKTLPTIAVPVLTCPPNFILEVVQVALLLDPFVAAYTNIDATAKLKAVFTGTAIDAVTPLDEATGDVTALLATGPATSDQAGAVSPRAMPTASRNGIGLSLKMTNGAAGNLTGGNAAHLLQVRVTYFFRAT